MKQFKILAGTLISLGALYGTIHFMRNLSKPQLRKLIENQIIRTYDQSKTQDQFLVQFNVAQEYSKNEQGYQFRIKVVQNQAQKPTTQVGLKNPFIPPFENGQFVMEIKQDFLILLNKYPVHPYHSLLVTKKFVEQQTPQTKELLSATYDILRALKGFAFFNSCKEAGASVAHKHIQIIPQSAYESADILNYISTYYKDNATITMKPLLAKLRYMQRIKHFICYFPFSMFDSTQEDDIQDEILYTAYTILIEACGCSIDKVSTLKHNLIITSEFMMIIVRKEEKFNGIGVNAMGFTGSFLAKNIEDFEILKKSKIIDILECLCEEEIQDHRDKSNKVLWI